MRSYLLFALSLFTVSSVSAEGGLRRLRRGVPDEATQPREAVNSNFLDLAKEVDGPALHRVLLHKQQAESRGRKMLSFGNFGPKSNGRDRLFDGIQKGSESSAGTITPPTLGEVAGESEMSMSMRLEMSMSMPETGSVADMSMSMRLEMSMSMPETGSLADMSMSMDLRTMSMSMDILNLSMSM